VRARTTWTLRSRATLSMEPKVGSAFSTGLPGVAAVAGASAVSRSHFPPIIRGYPSPNRLGLSYPALIIL